MYLVLQLIAMTIKEQIIQELDRIPESYLEKVLSFLYCLAHKRKPRALTVLR